MTILFSGAGALVLARQVFDGRPRLVYSDVGVLHRTREGGVIPWQEIEGAYVIRAFQVMDGVIRNNQPLFVVVWLGSVLALVVAAVLGLGHLDAMGRGLLIGATLAYLLGVQSLIAEGNVVAARYIETGTFRTPAFGHEPTGRSYELVAMEWFEISNGKIQRRWGARDAASQARQLGTPLS